LIGDARKAEKDLNWKATVQPNQLAALMVEHDIAILNGYISDKPVGSVWSEAIS
jgi:hypothetical protein